MSRPFGSRLCLLILPWLSLPAAAGLSEAVPAIITAPPNAQFSFGGPLGRRITANIKRWLIPAPRANPGMLEMFRVRDRTPVPKLVPWAGEFVGKYLISAVQALRMSEDPELKRTVAVVIRELLATQADDGYLGPFPKAQRLLGNWDLWGHYHIMLALLMWYERTGDEAALAACTKAADLVCAMYLDGGRRVIDAGSPEMNMSIIHSLGRLYRLTRTERYLKMMRHIETDWQRAGDYFRTGLAGIEYFRTPKPRWESLHCLQGLVELYLITGDERYRRAFLHHFSSIRRWDRRNTGGFSSGEQATGDPFAPTAIETCCTIAWTAITVDALGLTGDPTVADELELSLFNAIAGAQHPSGRWWTYNTPMDGTRAASAHTIVFQSRAGTPELNCCSVNAPRGLGMLSEWAVHLTGDAVMVNYLGPMKAWFPLADGTPIVLESRTRYPLSGDITIQITCPTPVRFTLRIRIPAWASNPRLEAAGKMQDPQPGSYAAVTRRWNTGDAVRLTLDLGLRAEPGDCAAWGKASIYRGPVLLAYDQVLNPFDAPDVPVLHLRDLAAAKATLTSVPAAPEEPITWHPWLVVTIPTGGTTLRLCDFASAGARGTYYRSWLPVKDLPPAKPVAWQPADGRNVPPGPIVFTWRRSAVEAQGLRHTLVIAESPACGAPVLEVPVTRGPRIALTKEQAARLKPNRDYYWKVVAANAAGTAESEPPHKRFRVDPSLPPLRPDDLSAYGERADGMLALAHLGGSPDPAYGRLVSARGNRPAEGPAGEAKGAVELDGRRSLIVYGIRRFPENDYSVALWVRVTRFPGRLAQIFSAWCRGMDDPLRISIDGEKLYARIEAGRMWSTTGIAIEPERWMHVAAVKEGDRLTLYVDGKAASSTTVPAWIASGSVDVALGGNPHFSGDESLAARFADFRFSARALTAAEVLALAKR